jgi:hypothetical protein
MNFSPDPFASVKFVNLPDFILPNSSIIHRRPHVHKKRWFCSNPDGDFDPDRAALHNAAQERACDLPRRNPVGSDDKADM